MSGERPVRGGLDHELESVRGLVAAMAGRVEQQLHDGLRALVAGDVVLGDGVYAADHRIDALERRLDRQVTAVLARRQPAGPELRFLVAAIRAGTDLERIGDEAGKLGRSALELAGARSLAPGSLRGLASLGEAVRAFLRAALDAFARDDTAGARALAGRAEAVATTHDGLTRELVTSMMEDPRSTQRVLQALRCARALERIADHASDLCEVAIYVAEGHRSARGPRQDS